MQRSHLRGFCHYPYRGVDAGHHTCKTTEYKSTESPLPPLLNVMHCVRVSLWTEKITEMDTLEQQQTEKIETEVKDIDRLESIQVYAILSRVSFCGVPFPQYHILHPHCRQSPLKEGNPQMVSSVQDNPAAHSPCQYGQLRVVPCPLPLEYQAASSQGTLKSCWALPPLEKIFLEQH